MRQREGWRWTASAAAGAVLSVGVFGVGASSAFAVGDRGLSKVIIPNPVPGWQAEPASSLNRVVTYIDSLESEFIVPQGGDAVTAVQGWRDPANLSRNVVIALVALRFDGKSATTIDAQARQGAIAALTTLCAGVAATSSVHASTVPHVPFSHVLTCTLTKGGAQPLAAGWARANTLALVLSTQNSMNAEQLSLIAATQYVAMGTRGFTVPASGGSSGGGLSTVLELVAGAVVLALLGFGLWRVLPPSGERRATRSKGAANARRAGAAERKAPAARQVPAATRASAAARAPRAPKALKGRSPQPEIRRGVVQRPASLAGGVGPPPRPVADPGPGSGGGEGAAATPPRPQP